MLHETNQKLIDYRNFTKKLALTTACTVLLSSGMTILVQNIVAQFSPFFPSWGFPLLEVIIASVGLWIITRNGKEEK